MVAETTSEGPHHFGLAWPSTLHAFQLAGVAHLLKSDSVLLADEMGLGKTIQVIAALRILIQRQNLRSALIIMPAGLLLQWRQQLRRWAPDLSLSTVVGKQHERLARWRSSAQVYLVGYEALRHDWGLPSPFGPSSRVWGVVIADEAPCIKNEDTDLSVFLKLLQRNRTWALTGTPVENSANDVASLIDFVAPGQLERREMMMGLRRVLSQVQVRRRRADVLPNLPPKVTHELPIVLGPDQRAAYDRAEKAGRIWLRSLGKDITIRHVLELILRLKQICNACPRTDSSAKRDDLLDRVSHHVDAGQKVLVFSQFVAAPFGVAMLAQHLASCRPLVVTGAMSALARDAMTSLFAQDHTRSVMILSLKAGGIGLNLTSASVVFHFDRWWNPASESQAEDRAHRIGQTRTVNTFSYLCQDTVEQRIANILASKRALFTDLIEDVAVSSLRRLDLPTLLEAVSY